MPRPKLPETQRRTASEFTMLKASEAKALTQYCEFSGHSRSAVLRLALLSFAPMAKYLPRTGRVKSSNPRVKRTTSRRSRRD